ncbi:Pr6Pr family membrane protein [Agrococcus sp. ProA11]|uniref:Pr6Pr family membrane protein n=1 Tax=Agrococcus chionoecetis TaxID=3153752 RepID=UPI003261278A
MTVTEDLHIATDRRRRWLLVGRASIAALILAAVVGQMVTSLVFWHAQGAHDLAQNVANYLSFFTVESNILSLVLLGILVAAQLGGPRLGRRFDVLLLGATSYMVVTAIVYNALMRGIELPPAATLDWANEVLHLIAPLWMVIDRIASTRESELQWRDVGTVTLFPAAWLAFTLLRAPKTPEEAVENPYWYPHLDPSTYDDGYFGVATTCLAVTALLVLAAAAQVAYVRWRQLSRN